MSGTGEIRAHMEVVGADGGHVGTVDRLARGHIRLTRRDDPDGSGAHHHALPLTAIRMVEGDRVWLTVPAQEARAMAVGGLDPASFEEGTSENGHEDDRASMSRGIDGPTGNIHGGGHMAPSDRGAGGTAAGAMGAGKGIPQDPNMDPSGRGDPDL